MVSTCTNRAQISSRKQIVHLFADGLHLFRLGVDIAVHSHADIGMSGDLLQGFDIAAFACRIGEVAVTENMSCCTVKVDGFFDAVPGVGVVIERYRLFVADDETSILHGCKQFQQHRIQRNITHTALGLGCADMRLIRLQVCDIALHMDQARFNIDVLPAQANHFALPHACKHQQGEQSALLLRQSGKLFNDMAVIREYINN